MEYYLVLKRNAVLIHAKAWINFENIVLNEMCVLVAQSCLTLCGPMDYSPQGSCVHGILQARMENGLSLPIPGDLPFLRIEPASLMSPALAGRFSTTSTTWEVQMN